ncbi:MAG TPA: Ig-like domain-containing protein [Longimicrobiales bacterium]|nr:Ig-like domain-containing protein [Longimicrobiales bacterium]
MPRHSLVPIALILLSACAAEEPFTAIQPALNASVEITPKTISELRAGQSVSLMANVSGASDNSVSWVSRKTLVARVDDSGRVTAISGGSSWIVAVLAIQPSVRDSVQIVVYSTTGVVQNQ